MACGDCVWYIPGMAIRRASHAVYDIKYHFVWIPKYRKAILTESVAAYVKEIFHRIAEEYEMEIDRVEIVEDHVHLLICAPPRYAPYQIVQRMKSISAREVFRRFPQLRSQLWAGELWSDGYFVRTVGDEVSAEIIRKYITYHQHQRDSAQLELPF